MGKPMNDLHDIKLAEQLNLKDQLYTLRQHKKVLEDRLEQCTFEYHNIPQKQDEDSQKFKHGLIPAIFYLILFLAFFLLLIYCFLEAAQGGGVGNEVVGLGILFGLPGSCYAGFRCFQRCQTVIEAKCTVHNRNNREEKVFEMMGSLKREIAALDREILEIKKKLAE